MWVPPLGPALIWRPGITIGIEKKNPDPLTDDAQQTSLTITGSRQVSVAVPVWTGKKIAQVALFI